MTQPATITESRPNEFWKKAIGIPRNTLTTPQMVQVVQAISSERDRIVRTRPQKTDVAAMLTERLQFKVTARNVVTAARSIGLRWTAAGPNRKKYTRKKPRPAQPNFVEFLTQLSNRVTTIEKGLNALFSIPR